jgi:hypothetical protein
MMQHYGGIMRQSVPFGEGLTGMIRRLSMPSDKLMEASDLAAGLNRASLRLPSVCLFRMGLGGTSPLETS